jgi:hypothetical protein
MATIPEKLAANLEKLEKLKIYTENIPSLKKVNVDDFKSSANRYFEDRWKYAVRDPSLTVMRSRDEHGQDRCLILDEIYWINYVQLHTINSAKKQLDKVDKANPDHPYAEIVTAARDVIREAEPYAAALAEFKERQAQAALLPKEPKDPIKQLPLPAQKSIRAIEAKLREKADELKPDLISSSVADRKSALAAYMEKPEEDRTAFSRKTDPGYLAYIGPMLVKKEGIYQPAPNVERIILALATENAESVISHYIAKHSLKLASIIENMPGIAEIDIRARASGGLLEGNTYLKFEDERRFRVHSQIVHSYSVHGNPFYRYPTTFHDVVNADGSLVGSMVPEEDMIAWAGGKGQGSSLSM